VEEDRAGTWWPGSYTNGFALRLLLALHAGNRPARGAADLGDHALLLVFRQVFDQEVVGTFQFGVAVDLFE
jgi:hypothetical protein